MRFSLVTVCSRLESPPLPLCSPPLHLSRRLRAVCPGGHAAHVFCSAGRRAHAGLGGGRQRGLPEPPQRSAQGGGSRDGSRARRRCGRHGVFGQGRRGGCAQGSTAGLGHSQLTGACGLHKAPGRPVSRAGWHPASVGRAAGLGHGQLTGACPAPPDAAAA